MTRDTQSKRSSDESDEELRRETSRKLLAAESLIPKIDQRIARLRRLLLTTKKEQA